MSCAADYIAIDKNSVSRSGLYASDLPGVESLLYELISKDQETVDEVWERIYRNAWNNLVSDVEAYLQSKFFVNQKLVSRETSDFTKDSNQAEGAGVFVDFDLPRYARIHVLTVEVWSETDTGSPGAIIKIFDAREDGDLLYEDSMSLVVGRNTINIDQDFESDELLIVVNAPELEIRGTEAKRYAGASVWRPWECMFPCLGGTAHVEQINGGGLNVVYNIYCSAEKFVCQNINLFKKTLWWKVGQELIIERRYGNRLNEFTTMTEERAEELTAFYQANYSQAIENSLKAHNIFEDPFCFECKGVVNTKTLLP